MSVRRLAETQPKRFAFNKQNAKWVADKIREYPEGRQASAILPILMRAQEQEGWVTKPMLETVAEMLEVSYIRALEVATFYTMFQLAPVGTVAHIRACCAAPRSCAPCASAKSVRSRSRQTRTAR